MRRAGVHPINQAALRTPLFLGVPFPIVALEFLTVFYAGIYSNAPWQRVVAALALGWFVGHSLLVVLCRRDPLWVPCLMRSLRYSDRYVAASGAGAPRPPWNAAPVRRFWR